MVATLLPLLAGAVLQQAPGTEGYVDTIAVVGARIEVGDGRVIERGNVVVRDGRIQAVGADAPVPRFARVIDGKGLTVYPGFIDAYANSFLTIPEPQPDQDTPPNASEDAPAYMRPANRRGVRPELEAGQYFAPTLAGLLPERRAGFTHFIVSPTGGIMNGRASLVELSGVPRRDSVLRPEIGVSFGFRSAGGGYPGSLLGVFAQMRQALLDAQWYQSLPANEIRPDDATLRSLGPVIQRRLPVFFEAETDNEVERALRMSQEFNFPVVLVGVLEGFRIANRLREVPVIASLDFGAEPRARTPRAEGTPPNTGDDQPEPVRTEREGRFRERLANLGQLEKAGVRFALTGRGLRERADFFRNLKRAVDAGLSRQRALRALTIDAATIAGVADQTGTIEAGKLANLFVAQGDFLDPNMRVRTMLIRGRLFRPDRDRVPGLTPRPRNDENHHHDDNNDGCCSPQVTGGGR